MHIWLYLLATLNHIAALRQKLHLITIKLKIVL